MEKFSKKISDILLFIMNIALAIIGFCLVFAMLVETWEIVLIAKSYFQNDDLVYTKLIEEIITFFLYFEFIALIIKYFKNNFHFPLRYFIYIGITAIVRLIIVQHEEPKSVLIWAGAILLLMISLAIAERFVKGD